MDPPPRLEPGTVRWKVLSALATGETPTAPKIAVETRLSLERTLEALRWATRQAPALADLRFWVGVDSVYTITDHGREALAAGAQLALDVI